MCQIQHIKFNGNFNTMTSIYNNGYVKALKALEHVLTHQIDMHAKLVPYLLDGEEKLPVNLRESFVMDKR